ncbi:MAG TPA: DNA alkylation repair protein [Candidatus Saccharimonadales bacterium]|nr:DNA alkylation repair protein [Candidatus Saccharimonadales bacterium]
MQTADNALAELENYASPKDGEFLQGFFKTGEGQYGAGDVFIGVRVPDTRKVAKKFQDISLADVEQLLESPIHEMRLLAVIIMANQANKAGKAQHKALLGLYLRRTDRVNNWDIVDASCRNVVGEWVLKHPADSSLLLKLAASKSLWERRIAMVSTWALIRAGQLDTPYLIAETLLADKHDLIQKAVGWMLRTMGDKDPERLRCVPPHTHCRHAAYGAALCHRALRR